MTEEIILDEEYEFAVEEKTKPDYKMTALISQWIYSNLENLTDDNEEIIFNKVNYGYNEESLKSFGKKPVCDVYVNNVDYESDLQESVPVATHSIIIFHVKGGNDTAYLKACQLHDYIMQQFIENKEWQELDDIVSNTVITNSELLNHPRKGWAVMGAFEVEHTLYR